MPVLQINFKLNVPAAIYAAGCQNVVQAIADVPGLRWKIWILNEQEKEAGGLYCFDTDQALTDYVTGPIVGQLRNHPAVTDVNMKRFQVLEELTAVTRGPISNAAAA